MSKLLNHTFRRYVSTNTLLRQKKVQIRGPSGVTGDHGDGYKLWRNLFFFGALPAIAVCSAYCYMDHLKHGEERPPFHKYEYLRIRTKRFPWGDGNHSFFHNSHVNALPDGYED